MTETKEKTAQSASVGADAEQSSNNLIKNSIEDETTEFNENLTDTEAWERFQRSMDPRFLNTVTMTELYDTVY